jgi:glycosyltransferase involved in cell wall biosynthesis
MVITVSKDLMKYYIKQGVNRKKMRLVYNGVDVKRYIPASKKKGLELLFVGNLVERKGVIYLLKAFKKIKEQIPDAKLFIVGRRNEKSDYVRELRKNSMEGVTFIGIVTEEQLIGHYQSATMLVHPPLYEAFGMTLVEAMACGTPVVATDVGGIPEVLGDDEILIKARKSDEIAKAVLKLAGNKRKLDSMGKKGRKRVEDNFSWETVSKNVSSLYNEF